MIIYLVSLISFLFGLIVNLVAFPYILEFLVLGVWRYIKNVNTQSIFRWTVSFIVSFSISMLLVQYQGMKIQKETKLQYEYLVDSLRMEIQIQHYIKAK